jgi:signal transduction histidine kinase
MIASLPTAEGCLSNLSTAREIDTEMAAGRPIARILELRDSERAALSHELRTALNAIIGLTEMMVTIRRTSARKSA